MELTYIKRVIKTCSLERYDYLYKISIENSWKAKLTRWAQGEKMSVSHLKNMKLIILNFTQRKYQSHVVGLVDPNKY